MANLIAFDSDFLTDPNSDEPPRLIGTKCRSCGVVTFGKRHNCEHCTSDDINEITLSEQGKIWSYTILHYPSPPPYRPPDPFIPIPAAWIELPEGVRILSPLKDCRPNELKIGLDVELVVEVGWQDEDGNNVLAFGFRPVNPRTTENK